MGLIEKIDTLNKRVESLENKDLDEGFDGLARISKLYGNIRVSVVVRTRKYVPLTPRATLYPSNDLYSETYFD